jgi:hypothetical protein
MATLNSAPGTPLNASTAWMESEMLTTRTTYLRNNRYDSWGPELVIHSKSVAASQYAANVQTSDDTIIPISSTAELDALLDLYGVPYEKYAALGAGQKWSRGQDIEAKLDRLLAR